MGSVGEIRCERTHIGSIEANAGLQVTCNPASSVERATEIDRRRPAWEFHAGLTKCHFLSEFITCGHGPDLGFSRFVIPSHAIWAASWAVAPSRHRESRRLVHFARSNWNTGDCRGRFRAEARNRWAASAGTHPDVLDDPVMAVFGLKRSTARKMATRATFTLTTTAIATSPRGFSGWRQRSELTQACRPLSCLSPRPRTGAAPSPGRC
jgi:hypothetical protein